MRVLVFEDEQLTAERLVQMIKQYDAGIEILGVLGSVAEGLDWFTHRPVPDLVFMDIHLRDGSCFELFDLVNLTRPVIFTTAYNEYAIRAFRVNSIDYLVKPIDFHDLRQAMDKYVKLSTWQDISYKGLVDPQKISYRQRFLVKMGDQWKQLKVEDIAYFLSEQGMVIAVSREARKVPLHPSLDELEKELDPGHFFRVNRRFICRHASILKIHTWFNSRLKLELDPPPGEEVIVSRERVPDFKKWLDS